MPTHGRSTRLILVLGDDTFGIPIHLPKVGVADHRSGGHPLLAITIHNRSGKHLFAVNDSVALGHHLVDHILWDGAVATGNVGSASCDSRKSPIRIGLPMAGGQL